MDLTKFDKFMELAKEREHWMEYDKMFQRLQAIEEKTLGIEPETTYREHVGLKKAAIASVTFNYRDFEGEGRSVTVELSPKEWQDFMVYAYEWVTVKLENINHQIEEL